MISFHEIFQARAQEEIGESHVRIIGRPGAGFVCEVKLVSRLKYFYASDRYNTLKSFKIGSSYVNTSLSARFPGIKDITIDVFRNVL